MKKAGIIIIVIIALIGSILVILPSVFKPAIVKFIEDSGSKYLTTALRVKNVSVGMFKNFPNLNVVVEDVLLQEDKSGSEDTLAFVSRFCFSVNLKSLISGDTVKINKIEIKDAVLKPEVDTSGRKNWEIWNTGDEETADVKAGAADSKKIKIGEFDMENLRFKFSDYRNSAYAEIADVAIRINGDFGLRHSVFNTHILLSGISYRRSNIRWLDKTVLRWDTDIVADFENKIFELNNGSFLLNNLKLNIQGKLGMEEDGYDTDFLMDTPETDFSSILALIPEELKNGTKDIKTRGNFNIRAMVKGKLKENEIPHFDIRLNVENGMLQYARLPESIDDIDIMLHAFHPGGKLDSAIVDLSKLNFKIGNTPFDLKLKVENLNDPEIHCRAKGKINFAEIKRSLPVDSDISGDLSTELYINGKYRYIENEEYEKFTAEGFFDFREIKLKDVRFPQGLYIPQGRINIYPDKLHMSELSAALGVSDFKLDGYIRNYLPYLFKNKELKGRFSLKSEYLNLNEFSLRISDTTGRNIQRETKTSSAVEIPKNIDFDMNTDIKRALWDNLDIRNIYGNIVLRKGIAYLNRLKMNMLKGEMEFYGTYNTTMPRKPKADFKIKARELDIHSAYNSFTSIRKTIPFAANCSGNISWDMNFFTELDEEMNPVMKTAGGNGYIASKDVVIGDNALMSQLAGLINAEKLKRLDVDNLKIDFEMDKGNIIIKPFKTKIGGNSFSGEGKQGVDGSIDYNFSMNIDRKYFGGQADKLLSAIPGSENLKDIDLDIHISGTLTHPVLKPDFSKTIKKIRKEAGNSLINKIKGFLK